VGRHGRLDVVKRHEALALALVCSGVVGGLAQAQEVEILLENCGYAVAVPDPAIRRDVFEVNRKRVSEAECTAAGAGCTELVICPLSITKKSQDPLDQETPLLCVTVLEPMPQGSLRSPQSSCLKPAVGETVSFPIELEVPADPSSHWVRLSLEAELRSDETALQRPIARMLQEWSVPAREVTVEKDRWRLTPVILIVGAAAVIVFALTRPARPRFTFRPSGAEAEAEAGSGEEPGTVAKEPADMRLEVYPSELAADGRSTATLIAQLLSVDGSPTPGVPVAFSTDLGEGATRLSPQSTTTDEEGVARTEFTMPRRTALSRIYLTAESTSATGRRLSRRQWIRVAEMILMVSPERTTVATLMATPFKIKAVLVSDTEKPLADVELAAELQDSGGSAISPPSARTDAKGELEFRFSPGDSAAIVKVRVWPVGRPDVAQEVTIEQVVE
jgi:hypothetical protein